MFKRPTMRCAIRGFLWLALATSGCAPRGPSVSGTVTFKGEPLPSGTVLFHAADGRIEHGLITGNGKYTVANAPPGPVRITVRSHPPAPVGLPSRGGPLPSAPAGMVPPAKEQRDGKFVAIPPRYLDPAQSTLTYNVRAGKQTYDIEL